MPDVVPLIDLYKSPKIRLCQSLRLEKVEFDEVCLPRPGLSTMCSLDEVKRQPLVAGKVPKLPMLDLRPIRSIRGGRPHAAPFFEALVRLHPQPK